MQPNYKKKWAVADGLLFSKYIAGMLITLLVICFCPGPARGVIIDGVAAVVNGEIISLSDVVKQEQRMARQAVSGIPQQTP